MLWRESQHITYSDNGGVIMDRLKIAVYAISKNEEKFVKRWMQSMSEADAVYVCDTGSTDNTVEELKKLGANVKEIEVIPWRFDTARNISMDFVPHDYDVLVCTDLDEYFNKGWREEIEKVWVKGKTTRMKYQYTWSFNDDNSPATTFWYEKIHSKSGFRWEHPVHEILEYDGEIPDRYAISSKIRLEHHPDDTKSRSQYLELLELSVKETPDDDRNMHYLGREYMFRGMWDKCIETLEKHLSLPSATWLDERCASMRYMAKAYIAKGDNFFARRWLYRAIAEAPYLREPYVDTARLAYDNDEWLEAYHMIEEALKIKTKPQTYINEGYCWDYSVYDIGAISAYNIGLKRKSLEYARKAFELNPDDERLKENVEIIERNLI